MRQGLLAVLASFCFGIGGPFVKPLLDAGWTSSAAVLARTGGAAVVLALPALLALRGRWGVLRRSAAAIVAYGAFAVAGAQLCYYSAIQHLPVGVALLIEYLAPVFLVLFTWLRTRRYPGLSTLGGSLLSLLGLLLVVDLRGGTRFDVLGVVLALGAAFGACVYYVVSAGQDPELPPVVLTFGAMVVATVLLAGLGITGVVPVRATFGNAPLLGAPVSWVVPATIVVGISTVAAYSLGVVANGRLGTRVASFAGLTEVLFAILGAWLLLGDLPAPLQLAGGVLLLAGVVLVRARPEHPSDAHPTGKSTPRPKAGTARRAGCTSVDRAPSDTPSA